MTVKVIKANGEIEEYPNAHISWEWDESEKGTDSGWRILAMDKKCTHVSTFIYPRDCQKIEITHDESDMVFKRPPDENCISGSRYRIFSEIDKDCKLYFEVLGYSRLEEKTKAFSEADIRTARKRSIDNAVAEVIVIEYLDWRMKNESSNS